MTPEQQAAMRQALAALNLIDEAMPFPVAKHAITALRQALEQPAAWVGLTDEDMTELDVDGVLFARYIEAKLREKNGGKA